MSYHLSPDSPGEQGTAPPYEAEIQRAKGRREGFKVVRPEGHDDEQWALAFSGGGIRSATFCLGVLQGLARAPRPQGSSIEKSGQSGSSRESLLPQFDYLSTVSGGGYIGSFFGSLFARGRLNKEDDPPKQGDAPDPALDAKTAQQAYEVFAHEPPGRLTSRVHFTPERPGAAPLAWLRENGRYMAPTGSGDMVYAASLAVRNWFSVQYVLGIVFLTAFALIALGRAGLVAISCTGCWLETYRTYELSLLKGVTDCGGWVWWSPVWWVSLPVALLWVIPCGLAFWFTHPPRGGTVQTRPKVFSKAGLFGLLLGFLLVVVAAACYSKLGPNWRGFARALGALGALSVGAFVWYATTARTAVSIGVQRVTLTRMLTTGCIWLAGVTLVALVDTTAQSIYVLDHRIAAWLTSTAATGGLAWVLRQMATSLPDAAKGGWLSKIPASAAATIGGVALLFLTAMFWSLLVLWIRWRGESPVDLLESTIQTDHVDAVIALAVTFGIALILSLVGGRFPGFLNLSTLQTLYSARLTRAYLGASNGDRFGKGSDKLRSVAEPAPGDQMTMDRYYDNSLMPIHIINVCLNQTSDPGEQLVQRDRKGKPLAVLPSGFVVDGKLVPGPGKISSGELDAELTLGEWVGVSGAAFSTALGRGTTLGLSLLMGLTNIRLGRWWASGITSSGKGSGAGKQVTGMGSGFGKGIRTLFKTQTYLFYELFATFHGTRRPLLYLSDGGHFENTAIYELLRPERKVRLIVVCDCGCDPGYQFDDIANLVRLARIDFRIEVEVDREIAIDNILGPVFGVPEDFVPGDDKGRPESAKCALLLKVYHAGANPGAGDTPDAHVVVLKPRLVSGVPVDLAQYHSAHTDFPQESTTDQFYDEAQWESYRKLGLEISTRVFGGSKGDDTFRNALWKYLERVKPAVD
ncbi:MAG TPA: hypothetical protein PLR37_01625 [Candidatus Accumulibacter phosphatis]|uniref:hypothetical protein n=1 Tax=Accumulibacter sp. TaxID=2053492 RepID=UPI0004524708|nr:hypothetical protein [Accumulibacter sp.]HRF10824.1 hypothetical protein [Candidatus Accumulibacter phosphatis]